MFGLQVSIVDAETILNCGVTLDGVFAGRRVIEEKNNDAENQ